jgi:hypothetical protein
MLYSTKSVHGTHEIKPSIVQTGDGLLSFDRRKRIMHLLHFVKT